MFQSKLEARLARLAHFEFGFSESEYVPDADFFFGHAAYCQIFTESTGRELKTKSVFPIWVVIVKVGADCLVLAAVIFQVSLSVPFKICFFSMIGKSAGSL